MQSTPLLDNLVFGDNEPVAERIFDDDAQVLRCTLRPGQMLWKCRSPSGPVRLVILAGRGKFTGQDGRERLLGAATMVTFEKNELHKIRALDKPLVLVAIVDKSSAQSATSGQYLVWHRRPSSVSTETQAKEEGPSPRLP